MDQFCSDFKQKIEENNESTHQFYLALVKNLPDKEIERNQISIEDIIHVYYDYAYGIYAEVEEELEQGLAIIPRYSGSFKKHILNFIFSDPTLKSLIKDCEDKNVDPIEFLLLITSDLPVLSLAESTAFVLESFKKYSKIVRKENKTIQDFVEIYRLQFLHQEVVDKFSETASKIKDKISEIVTDEEKQKRLLALESLALSLEEIFEKQIDVTDILKEITTESFENLHQPTPHLQKSPIKPIAQQFGENESGKWRDESLRHTGVTSTKFQYLVPA